MLESFNFTSKKAIIIKICSYTFKFFQNLKEVATLNKKALLETSRHQNIYFTAFQLYLCSFCEDLLFKSSINTYVF